MKKDELVALLEQLNIPINEGIASDKNSKLFPRIVYWDYYWEDVMSSGEEYELVETYQVSFFAKQARHPKLLELKKLLNEAGLHPTIAHEYNEKENVFHSYLALEVVTDE